MRVFVTGGTGYVGSSIVAELSRGGHEVTILSQNPAAHSELAALEGVTVIQGDLDKDVVQAEIAGHDALIHNALLWDEEPTEYELKDPRATVRLFRSAAQVGVGQIIYTSSTAVNRPFQPLMSDQTAIRTSDMYGATKGASELFLFAIASEARIRANVIRLGPVVGPPALNETVFKSDRKLMAFAQSAVAGEPIPVGKGAGRQFISNSDAARTFRAVLESQLDKEVFVCVDAEAQLWKDLARSIVAKAGSKSPVILEEPTDDPPRPMFDTTKLEREFGFIFDSRFEMDKHLDILIRAQQPQ